MVKNLGENRKKYSSVSIPLPLYGQIKDIAKETGFSSVSAYVSSILKEIISTNPEKDRRESEPFEKGERT